MYESLGRAGEERRSCDCSVLRVAEALCRFPYGELPAVRDLSLRVPPGFVFGLLGPNGSGRTTVLKMAASLLRPTRGQVMVHGLDPVADRLAVRRLLGLVPQETALYEDLTAYENLRFHYALYADDPRGMARRIGEVLELLQLSRRAHHLVRSIKTW